VISQAFTALSSDELRQARKAILGGMQKMVDAVIADPESLQQDMGLPYSIREDLVRQIDDELSSRTEETCREDS
jgi:hypothetical protein